MRTRPSILLLGLVLLSTPSLVSAQVLEVPGDHEDLQEALDAAPPGATILVHGGIWRAVEIHKPVTLLGDSGATIVTDDLEPELATAAVTLAGAGAGTVVLAGLHVTGTANGFLQSAAQATIAGGGFEELHVYDSEVEGAHWVLVTGVAPGASAIDVDVDYVLLSGSTVRGGRTRYDGPTCGGPPSAPGLVGGFGVIVLDSTVQGGTSEPVFCDLGSCPPPTSGAGGAGLISTHLYHAGSTIVGGAGALLWDSTGDLLFCGVSPAGEPFLAYEFPLSGDLHATSDLRLGQTWSLAWTSSVSVLAAVYVEERLEPWWLGFPTPVFLDLVGPRVLAAYGAGANSLSMLVPADPGLIGLRLTAQLYERKPVRNVTRPVTDVIRP